MDSQCIGIVSFTVEEYCQISQAYRPDYTLMKVTPDKFIKKEVSITHYLSR